MTKLAECFVQALGVEPEQVVDTLAYQSITQWDSVGHMALVAEIEAKFDIMLDTDDIVGMSSVAKAAEIVARHGADPKA